MRSRSSLGLLPWFASSMYEHHSREPVEETSPGEMPGSR
jgi:hypothetical protein